MDNQVIFGGQINMQNNMRTIHVGIFHLIKKTKKKQQNMLGIKTLILWYANLVANSTELKKSRNSEFLFFFLILAISEGSGESVHFRKFDLALKFEK